MLKHLVITLFLMGFALPALADDIGEANELLVEAVQLLQSAEGTTDAMERLKLSEEALGNLNEIVERYPSTDLAVKLITGQAIGSISMADVAAETEELRKKSEAEAVPRTWDECQRSPNSRCVVARALDIVVVIEDNWQSTKTLYEISIAQAMAGDVVGAKKTIAQVLNNLDKFQPAQKTSLLTNSASAQLATGDVEGAEETIARALATAEKIWFDMSKDSALSEIATVQAAAGDVVGAIATMEKIEDNKDRRWAGIVTVQAAAGNVVGAIATAERISIKNLHSRAKSLVEIARAQAVTGDAAGAEKNIAKALSTAEMIDKDKYSGVPEFRARLLARIAPAKAASGDLVGAEEIIAQAFATAEMIDTEYGGVGRHAVLKDIASGQAAIGDLGGAKAIIAYLIRDDVMATAGIGSEWYAITYAELAQALAKMEGAQYDLGYRAHIL